MYILYCTLWNLAEHGNQHRTYSEQSTPGWSPTQFCCRSNTRIGTPGRSWGSNRSALLSDRNQHGICLPILWWLCPMWTGWFGIYFHVGSAASIMDVSIDPVCWKNTRVEHRHQQNRRLCYQQLSQTHFGNLQIKAMVIQFDVVLLENESNDKETRIVIFKNFF